VRIRDHEHVLAQRAGDAIERHQAFPPSRASNDDPPLAELLQVERVKRMAELEKDEVRDIGDVIDASLAESL
jgi:hypothetical protein